MYTLVCALLLSPGMSGSPAAASVASILLLVACTTGDSVEDGGDTSIIGAARYRDAVTDAEGRPRAAAPPAAQPAEVEIVVRGVGDLAGADETDDDCRAEMATGEFYGTYDGTARVYEGGDYDAALS